MELTTRNRSIPSQQERTESNTVQHKSAHQLLYTSHALSTWNSRSFEFGAFLFIALLYPATLLPASIYALARAAAAALLAPWIGTYIDSHDRLKVIRLSISAQRSAVIASCTIFAALLLVPEGRTSILWSSSALIILSFLACVEKLAIVMNTISIERDWVVVIAGNDAVDLNRLNSRMRRIDLFSKLVAPLAVASLASFDTNVAVITTGLLSVASWTVEYFAIARVYHAVPELQDFQVRHTSQQTSTSLFIGVKLYFQSEAVLPSLALSFLYLTALSFNGQLITYLLAPPLTLLPVILSVVRGVAACAELSATFLAPIMIDRIGPLRAGSWFLNTQLLFVAIAAATLWLPLSIQLHLVVLIIAVILSRVGLWGFDLAAQQQIQDAVSETSRGAFSSIEAAIQNAFEMLSFATTIIWARPEDFKYPGGISAAAVLLAAMLYALFVRKHRGHLLHFEKALCGNEYWMSHFGKPHAWSRLSEDDET